VSNVPVTSFGPLELWVGNARHAAAFFTHVLGFSPAGAPSRPGAPDRVSYELRQEDARIVVTGGRTADSPVAEFVRRHGDGVRDIGFTVDTITGPVSDDDTVATFGDTTHSFHGPADAVGPRSDVGLVALDHLAVSLDPGTRERWADFYERRFGFARQGRDEHVDLDGSRFDMTTVQGPADPGEGPSVTLALVEPAPGRRRNQIADYLEHYGGPGVHHIAFSTHDIVATVVALRRHGLRTLDVPPTYYVGARARLDGLDLPWTALEQLGVLVDRDEHGHLFQAFTESIGDRPTVCLELIQRVGATGFGHENIRALYDAVLREQESAPTP